MPWQMVAVMAFTSAIEKMMQKTMEIYPMEGGEGIIREAVRNGGAK